MMMNDDGYQSGTGPGAWISQDFAQTMHQLQRELARLAYMQESGSEPPDGREMVRQNMVVIGLKERVNSLYEEMREQHKDIVMGRERGYRYNPSGVKYSKRWY